MPLAGGPKVRVSRDGGAVPRLPARGGEVILRSGWRAMSAPVRRDGEGWAAGPPVALFDPAVSALPGADVTADGQRFLIALPEDDVVPITVVVGWRR